MEKIRVFLNRYYVLVTIYFLLALALILFAVLFLDDIQAPTDMLIYNIFGTLAILGYLQSYQFTFKKMKISLAIGNTRKQIYRRYLLRLLISLGLSVLLVVYYITIFKLYVNQYFDYSKIIFLPLVTVILSLLGFFEGLLRIKFYWVIAILTVIVGGLAWVVISIPIPYHWDGILLVVATLFVFINRFFIFSKTM
ncbi:MAG: hypothetical protein AB7T03_03065 [Bacilli bacterium]